MSTYLVAFVVGEYDFVETRSTDGVLVRVYTPVGKAEQGKFALEVKTPSPTLVPRQPGVALKKRAFPSIELAANVFSQMLLSNAEVVNIFVLGNHWILQTSGWEPEYILPNLMNGWTP